MRASWGVAQDDRIRFHLGGGPGVADELTPSLRSSGTESRDDGEVLVVDGQGRLRAGGERGERTARAASNRVGVSFFIIFLLANC